MKTLDWKNGVLEILDQRQLPHQESIIKCHNMLDVADAIKVLAVRGAPAIGVAAGYGMVIAYREYLQINNRAPSPNEYDEFTEELAEARPTAVNLQWAVERMKKLYEQLYNKNTDEKAILTILLEQAQKIEMEDVRLTEAISRNGAALFDNSVAVLTHCNAGSLATVGQGTALGIIRNLHNEKKLNHVYIDETRPLLQGARLTTYEMLEEKIPATLICDNMAAMVMSQGKVDAVIVGADRIAANGDTANKIGTYGLAIIAAYHEIPFYIAAPSTTFDFTIETGDEIIIEERDAEEIRSLGSTKTAPDNIPVYNPAFDVTPAELITGIVTEKGVLVPPYKESIKMLEKKVK